MLKAAAVANICDVDELMPGASPFELQLWLAWCSIALDAIGVDMLAGWLDDELDEDVDEDVDEDDENADLDGGTFKVSNSTNSISEQLKCLLVFFC